MADTACLRAELEHGLCILFALPLRGPVLAVRSLVLADGGANTACHWAVGMHMCRVLEAFVIESPHCACGRVLVSARFVRASSEAAAERARLERMAGVVHALAVLGPSWAVVVHVLALWLADSARDRTVGVHEQWVGLAMALLAPSMTIRVDVGTFRRA